MARIQDGEQFKRLYQEVWSSGILRPGIIIYYSPRREASACIIYGDNVRFFRSIRDCIAWAVREGLIKEYDSAKIIESAEKEAEYIEELDDQFIDAADAHFRLNRDIAQASAYGTISNVARIIRRFQNKWSWW